MCFTLEEFLEKFPYKVGDKVKLVGDKNPSEITYIRWDVNQMIYRINTYDNWLTADELQSYKEEKTFGECIEETIHECLYEKEDKVNTKQKLLDQRYMRMALIWAENSYCTRRKVGALIVKDKMIISDGYNGTPSGFENVCELDDGTTKPYVLHAEANAITKIAKTGNNSNGATLYVTTSPCVECSKLIIQSGIKRVVYLNKYRITDGLVLLERAGVEVVHISLEE